MCSATSSRRAEVGVKVKPSREAIGLGIGQRLRVHAGDAAQHPRIGGRAVENLGDQAGQIFDARPHALLDQRIERRRRVVHLVLNQLVDRLVARSEEPVAEDRNPAPQLLFGRLPGAGLPRRLGGRPDRVDRRLQHLAIQPELVAEVVVDGGDVGVRGAAHLAHRDLPEPAIGEQPLRRSQQAVARRIVGAAGAACRRAPLRVPFHSVRLNRAVAADIATTENSSRNVRSPVIAPKPVFLSSRHFSACTA